MYKPFCTPSISPVEVLYYDGATYTSTLYKGTLEGGRPADRTTAIMPGLPELPHLEAYSRCTVIELVPVIASRLALLIEDGDKRDAEARARREKERAAEEGEGKRVRFEDRERKRRASMKMMTEEAEIAKEAAVDEGAGGQKEQSRWGRQADDTKFHARDRPGMTVEAYLMR